MRKQIGIAAAGCMLAVLATAVPVQAHVNQRQNRQQVRIANGISKGSLTAREAVRLERQQMRIARYEARSRADGGGLNRIERMRIEAQQDRASRDIYREKHDSQTR